MWKPNKNVKILLWAIAAISVIVCVYVLVASNGLSPRNPDDLDKLASVLNPLLYCVYILLAFTVIVAIVMPIPQLIKNPKGSVRMVLGVVAFGLVILVAYLFASSGNQDSFFDGKGNPIPEGTITLVSMNLYMLYLMLGLTIVVAVFAQYIVKLIPSKKK